MNLPRLPGPVYPKRIYGCSQVIAVYEPLLQGDDAISHNLITEGYCAVMNHNPLTVTRRPLHNSGLVAHVTCMTPNTTVSLNRSQSVAQN